MKKSAKKFVFIIIIFIFVVLKYKCGKKTKDAAHITRYFFYQLITKDLTTSGAVSERPATFSIYDVSTP